MHHELERGREHYRQRAWADAWQALSLADRAAPLVGEDLELLATSAYLIGRDECFLRALERAHHAHLETGHYRRACERCAQGRRGRAAAAAFYQQGEIHRLRGELEAAEGAYELADREGYEPQPGLALLRLAQGRADAATAAIRRILDATEDALLRSRLLPAYIEIMLAVGAVGEARNACVELERTSAHVGTEMLRALAAHARGAVDLAEGNTRSAVGFLRQTLQSWQRLEMPHAAARTRVLLGLACRQMHDEDGARLEWRAARAVFAQLGATPDLACVDALMSANPTVRADSLTPRELEVLRLVAAGSTNKAIAAQLSLSAKTVERHLSNIFTKLDVPSRAAATAHALRHRLI